MTETIQIQNNANQTARTSNRILWVDYSKVFVIWLMILGHIIDHSGLDGNVRILIYSFHLPFSSLSQVICTKTDLKIFTYTLSIILNH